MVEVANAILARLPRAEFERVHADLMDGGARSTLTARVLKVAIERANAMAMALDSGSAA
jgi:hypothetical protein